MYGGQSLLEVAGSQQAVAGCMWAEAEAGRLAVGGFQPANGKACRAFICLDTCPDE